MSKKSAPVKEDVDSLVAADRRARVEAAAKDIQAVLDKHRVELLAEFHRVGEQHWSGVQIRAK